MSLGFLTSTVSSIITVVAFGNLLSKETYGVYSYLLSLASTLGFLTLTGVGPGITRSVAQGEERVVPYAMKLQFKYNLIAIGTVGAAALYYALKGNTVFAIALGILAVAMPVAGTYHTFEQVLTGRKKFHTLTLLNAISAFSYTAVMVSALFFTQNVLVLVCIYSVMSLLPNMIAYLIVARDIPEGELSPEAKKDFRRSSLHITGAGLIGSLAQYVDKLVLFHVAGPVSLAIYNFAIAGPERLKGLIKNWVAIALPKLSERSITEIKNTFKKRVMLSLLSGVVVAGVYIVFSPILFKLLLPKYLDSIKYSQVYALNLIFVPVLVYVGNIFYSQNMLRAIYISSTGIQVLRILIFIIFGSLWQTWGLVIAAILYQLVSSIFSTGVWLREGNRLEQK